MKKLVLILLLLPLSLKGQTTQTLDSSSVSNELVRTISGSFSPVENYKWGILYRVSANGTLYTADTRMNDEGKFQIKMNSKVLPGIYRMVYGVPQDKFSFDLVYSGTEDIELVFSEENGVQFTSSLENKLWSTYQQKMTQIEADIKASYLVEKIDKEAVKGLFELQKETQQAYEKASEGTLSAKFIGASKAYIPNKYETLSVYQENSKKDYFKYINVRDTTLQQSRFIFEKVYSYISKKEDVDDVAAFLQLTGKEYEKSILLKVWEALVKEDRVEAANYLHKNHLSPLAKILKDTRLVNRLFKYEMLSIGHKSPNFSWKDEAGNLTWFHDLEGAQNYILVFWSSSCPHCLQELPTLQNKIKALPKNMYKVVAFGLEDDIYSWKNEILRLPEFYHIPGLGKWDNTTGKSYDVSQTPTYFVMDKEKVITAKPEKLTELFDIINEKAKE